MGRVNVVLAGDDALKKLLVVLLLTASPCMAEQVTCMGVTETRCTTLEGQDCAIPIINAINSAKQTLDVQYYNFTEPRIGDAIVAAAKRGVKVRAVFDKISPSQKGEQVQKLYDAGIPVWIDHIPAIAHDKVSVIDGHLTTGGSFNASTNADTKNAENSTLDDSVCIANEATGYITRRIDVSLPFKGGGK